MEPDRRDFQADESGKSPLAEAIATRLISERSENLAQFAAVMGQELDHLEGSVVLEVLKDQLSTILSGTPQTELDQTEESVREQFASTIESFAMIEADEQFRLMEDNDDENEDGDITREEVKEFLQGQLVSNLPSTYIVSVLGPEATKSLEIYIASKDIGHDEGVLAKDVFLQDNLYEEVIRRVFTPQEYWLLGQAAIELETPESYILRVTEALKRFAKTAQVASNDPEMQILEMVDDIVNKDILEDPDFRKAIRSVQNVALQVLHLRIERFWGKDVAESFRPSSQQG